jgi:anaerobic selenocysteine-containing dehydrogenase
MVVTLDERDRILSIDGDPLNPATGGHVCLKGLSYARRLTSPDRLLAPLARDTRTGVFRPLSWDEALEGIRTALDSTRRAHGAEAVLYYEGSGSHGALGGLAMAFWHQFGGCTVPYGDLCWPAGLEATRLTYGDNRHNHPRLTVNSRLIVVWGHNPAETNVHQWRLILDAQARGARLVVVDPRATDSSDAADLHVRPRPGTDAALALGLARAIVEAGLHDSAFLAEHASGFEEYRARLEAFPLTRVAAITGVGADTIQSLAVELGRTKPALLMAGFGLQRHSRAGQTLRAVALLPALTGNVGVAGGGWQYANLASHCLRPLPLPPAPPAMRGFPVSQLARHLETFAAPPIRAAWIERGNPAAQHPAAPRVRAALAALDCVVVVDQFLTPTARLAHFVLPAKTLFEEEDLVTAYWHPYLQWRARILEPPGGVKPESEIWRLLADRFSFDTSWFPGDRTSLLRALLPEGHADAIDILPPGRWISPGTAKSRLPTDDSRLPRAGSSSSRPKPRRGGALTRCHPTTPWPTVPNRRKQFGFRCSSCRAKRETGSTRSSAILTGCRASSGRTSSTSIRMTRVHGACATAVALRYGTNAGASNSPRA